MRRQPSRIGSDRVAARRSGLGYSRWLWGACAPGLLFVVFGCSQAASAGIASIEAPAQTDIWDGVYTEEQAARGQNVYTANCSFCHGEGLVGSEMAPVLTGSSFVKFWEGLSLGDLLSMMQTSMPQDSPGALSDQEYVDVLSYMLRMSEYPAGSTELPADGSGFEEIEIQTSRE